MNDISLELAKLHELTGADFIRQLKSIVAHNEFHPLPDETMIYVATGAHGSDSPNLLNAARKAVEHGYTVYILPNPRGTRTADFIFEKRGVYRMYDLKTIQGRASVYNRLMESVGQTNRVLLNMRCKYEARLLAMDIKSYFLLNPDAVEVLIFKGGKTISVSRYQIGSPLFYKEFRKKYEK